MFLLMSIDVMFVKSTVGKKMVKILSCKLVMGAVKKNSYCAMLIRMRNKLVDGKAIHFLGHVIRLEDNSKYSDIPCEGCEFISPESAICDLCLECDYLNNRMNRIVEVRKKI